MVKGTSKIIKQLFTQFITNNTNIKIYTKQISILDWAWAWWFETDCFFVLFSSMIISLLVPTIKLLLLFLPSLKVFLYLKYSSNFYIIQECIVIYNVLFSFDLRTLLFCSNTPLRSVFPFMRGFIILNVFSGGDVGISK